MYPVGGLHLKDSGYSKVAKKLGIDYAKVVVGFDFKRGLTTPRYRGILVDVQYKQVLEEVLWSKCIGIRRDEKISAGEAKKRQGVGCHC